jgi:polar amino acid transport system permease protein
VTIGYAAAVFLVVAVAAFIIANDSAVGLTFFFLPLMRSSFGLVLSAFWTNVYIFTVAEVLVLAWGLVVAIARLVPGPAGQPVRAIATVYTDIFRGLPAIICIYLVGFGLPLTGLPIIKDFPPEWYAILALTLTYGAYVAEVYRAGIDSVHWSQSAAARSLGLSFAQTLRYVIVPQAVRRIIPPLLNDFISLQKDTALVNVIGAMDAFNQAKIVASNHFNLSSVTTVAFLFVLITIPQARLVDKMIERDQRRTRAGG